MDPVDKQMERSQVALWMTSSEWDKIMKEEVKLQENAQNDPTVCAMTGSRHGTDISPQTLPTLAWGNGRVVSGGLVATNGIGTTNGVGARTGGRPHRNKRTSQIHLLGPGGRTIACGGAPSKDGISRQT